MNALIQTPGIIEVIVCIVLFVVVSLFNPRG